MLRTGMQAVVDFLPKDPSTVLVALPVVVASSAKSLFWRIFS